MPTFNRPVSSSSLSSGRTRARICLAAAALLAVGVLVTNGEPVTAGIVPTVDLRTAGDFSVLGATTVINTGPSVLDQSVGLSPGSAIVGFPPGIVLAPGTIEAANGTTLQARIDLTTAYGDAAGRSVEFTQTNPDLVGQTLIPGVYAATAKGPLGLSGQLVLDGQGNSDAVFIFQTDSTLTTSSGSTIALINGASECNVFWQVGSSATLGTDSVFVGNILALTSVTVTNGALVHGRALARNAAVTLDDNVFTQPSCVPSILTVAPTTTTAAAPTTTAGAATTTTAAAATTTTASASSTSVVTTTGVPSTLAGTITTVPPTVVSADTGSTDVSTTNVLGVDITDITLPPTGGPVKRTTGFAVLALLLGAAIAFAARRPHVHG